MNRVHSVLASLNCDGRRGLWLVLVCAALLLPAAIAPGLLLPLRYDRAAIGAGQLWRLASGHVVHLDPEHAELNAIGVVLLWALFAGFLRPRDWLLVLGAALVAIDLGFWFLEPRLRWYVGASGLLHGVMAAGTVGLLRQRNAIAPVTTLVFVAKLAWEQLHGPLPFETSGPVIVSAHLYGAAGGLVAGLVLWWRQRWL